MRPKHSGATTGAILEKDPLDFRLPLGTRRAHFVRCACHGDDPFPEHSQVPLREDVGRLSLRSHLADLRISLMTGSS